MLADLLAMVGAISDARVLGEVVFVMHPTRALAFDVPPRFSHSVLTSGEIADDTVIAIATDGIAGGYDRVPTIETSKFCRPGADTPTSPRPVCSRRVAAVEASGQMRVGHDTGRRSAGGHQREVAARNADQRAFEQRQRNVDPFAVDPLERWREQQR